MSHHELTMLLLGLAVLLGAARLFGELAQALQQPAVIGEILAGIVLGPTVLGSLAPGALAALFPGSGNLAIALEGLTNVALITFLLIAGMEVDLSIVWRQGKTALTVSTFGILGPFAIGLACWPLLYDAGAIAGSDPLVFGLFLATALSITALPVIAKILMDLNIYRTDLGMIVVASAIFNDLVGWLIFALILGMMESGRGSGLSFATTAWLTLAFSAIVLTAGRWLIHRLLAWVQAHATWPGGVLGFSLTGAILCAAITEWIGVHGIFGAFLFGVALGDSSHLRERTRATMEQFVSSIFAPLFFASIGLKVNFLAHFDLGLTLFILVIATVGKVLGCTAGARLSGISRRESWAIGSGMNARGAMEIVLGLLALDAGVIGETMFVALVVMALVTSMTSGALMQAILRHRKAVGFPRHLSGACFVARMEAADRQAAIEELARAAAKAAGMPARVIADAVWAREQIMATSLPNGLAVPHARLDGLKHPVVAAGIAPKGCDFDARDGKPAHLIFMILTPAKDTGAQLEILADIARTFRNPEFVGEIGTVASFTEFLALVKSGPA